MKNFCNKFLVIFFLTFFITSNIEAQTTSPVVFSRGLQFAYQEKYASQSVPGVTVHQVNGYRTYTAYWNGTFTYGTWQSLSAPMLTREITVNDVADGWLASMDQASTGTTFTEWPLYTDEVSQINGNEVQFLATVRVLREANGETFPLGNGTFGSGVWGPSTWVAVWNTNHTSQLLNNWAQLSYPRPSAGSLGIPARIWPPAPGAVQTPPYVYAPTSSTPATSYPAGCTSTAGFSSTTGQACSGISNLPAGCSSTSGFSSITGTPCSSAVANLPAGCSSVYGFSATTGNPCSGTNTAIPQPTSSIPPTTFTPNYFPTSSYSTSPTVNLKANGSDGPINVNLGSLVKISWTVSGQTACYKSSVPPSEFTGLLTPLNIGSQNAYPPIGGIVYKIICGNFADTVAVNQSGSATTTTTTTTTTGQNVPTSSLPTTTPATQQPTSTTPTNTTIPTTSSSTKFAIGDNVQATTRLKVRSTANGTVLGTVTTKTRALVSGGPLLALGLNWWKLDYVNGLSGWSAEDYLIKIETTPPTITLVYPPEGSKVNGIFPVVIQVSDNKSPHEYIATDSYLGNFTSFNGPGRISTWFTGTHESLTGTPGKRVIFFNTATHDHNKPLIIAARDEAGNVSLLTIHYVVDSSAPNYLSSCGNGVVDAPWESCDGNDLQSKSCMDIFGLTRSSLGITLSGNPICEPTYCVFNTYSPRCEAI